MNLRVKRIIHTTVWSIVLLVFYVAVCYAINENIAEKWQSFVYAFVVFVIFWCINYFSDEIEKRGWNSWKKFFGKKKHPSN